MNIAVIGATGMVGERTVTEATARGHQVEGYSRSGQAVAGAEGTAVDLSNTGELVTIINSHDVTIIAVSAGRGVSAEPVIQAHKALIAAKPSGRLLIVGGAGSLEDAKGQRFVNSAGFPEEYKAEALAFCQILDEYRASSDLTWTMFSPPSILPPASAPAHTIPRLTTPQAKRSAQKTLRWPSLTKLKPPSTLDAVLPSPTRSKSAGKPIQRSK